MPVLYFYLKILQFNDVTLYKIGYYNEIMLPFSGTKKSLDFTENTTL
jgi:hypothetical protein